MHPWEDWAETWAHYLHITDGAETAFNFGLNPAGVPIPFTPLPRQELTLPSGLEWNGSGQKKFMADLEAWAKLAPALNEIVASLGHEAFYPFVFSVEIARKFLFVHYAVESCRGALAQAPAPAPVEPGPAPAPAPAAPAQQQQNIAPEPAVVA